MSTSTAPVASPATPSLISTLPRGAALTDGLTVARRNLLRILRTPQLVFFSTIQPIMFVLLFNYVFGGAILRTGGKYIDYLLPGIMVQTVAFGATSTAIGLATDMTHGHHGPLPVAPDGPLRRALRADHCRRRPQPVRGRAHGHRGDLHRLPLPQRAAAGGGLRSSWPSSSASPSPGSSPSSG